ncbi:MAG TPA: class I SAM-dependent methyltransferase [Pyrinomonadaceae bacterium]|nr:class I SAM-dependent methyltransferase [Pyrinomonadaceae bacterium]
MISSEFCKSIRSCRICGAPELTTVIDLGEQYIATHFVAGAVPDFLDLTYPLELVRCTGPKGCGLVQLRHSVNPSVLYFDYGYRSGINQSMRDNLADITAKVENIVNLQPGDTVLDIGCNDGTLLCSYGTAGLDRIGVDPSTNVLALAREKGLNAINDYFSAAVYNEARPDKKAKVVTSIAMFYDLERPGDFVRDVASILADDGVWVIELSYLPFMLQMNSFDTICHEHLEYYSLRTLEWLLDQEGMGVQRLELNGINGGSVRLFIRHQSAIDAQDPEVETVRKREQELGLQDEVPYLSFRKNVARVRDDLRRLLHEIKERKQSVYIYGASTKGNTILQFCGIDNELVPKAADRNPDKWGRHTLGTNIEIISEDQARAERPDYFLVLPWHFFDEFKERERSFLEGGGKFILPLPEVRVIGQEAL